ncbi:unnamed protein product [Strongylus vulgaris]|uniref:Uncharacterized protein n=1 Tax=Strongylus vulgaris TaxID=40348 RepID=A0A3P7M1K8_STRVU|nr:unnamed protein product [Strongylus vulgaris]
MNFAFFQCTFFRLFFEKINNFVNLLVKNLIHGGELNLIQLKTLLRPAALLCDAKDYWNDGPKMNDAIRKLHGSQQLTGDVHFDSGGEREDLVYYGIGRINSQFVKVPSSQMHISCKTLFRQTGFLEKTNKKIWEEYNASKDKK